MADTLVEKVHAPWQSSGDNYIFRATKGPKSIGSTSKPIYLNSDGTFSACSTGSGSGLDADLLDGQNSSYYAKASDLDNYVTLTGSQTITGEKTFTMNPIIAKAGVKVEDSSSSTGCKLQYNTTTKSLDFVF